MCGSWRLRLSCQQDQTSSEVAREGPVRLSLASGNSLAGHSITPIFMAFSCVYLQIFPLYKDKWRTEEPRRAPAVTGMQKCRHDCSDWTTTRATWTSDTGAPVSSLQYSLVLTNYHLQWPGWLLGKASSCRSWVSLHFVLYVMYPGLTALLPGHF